MKNRLIPVVLATLLAGAGLTAQAAVSPTPSSAAVGASVDLAKRGRAAKRETGEKAAVAGQGR